MSALPEVANDASNRPIARSYFLAQHSYVCAIHNDVIVLDLRSDQYLGFDRKTFDRLGQQIQGWPSPSVANDVELDADDLAVLKELVDAGIVTENGAIGKEAVPLSVPQPSHSLLERFGVEPPVVRAADVVSFVRAVVTTKQQLRRRPLQNVLECTTKLKLERSASGRECQSAAELSRVFNTLRPIFFASRDKCLLESLALLRFLLSNRSAALMVFGVRTAPFGAHCWVQSDDCVLNDTLDHVLRYVPIMAI